MALADEQIDRLAGSERVCRHCSRMFVLTRAMARTYRSICGKCRWMAFKPRVKRNPAVRKAWVAKQRAANLEEMRRKDRERMRIAKQRWPEQAAAHQAVKVALATGRLQKQPCEVCGLAKVDAHHDDYSKPFEIRWLCRRHHWAEHGRRPVGVTSEAFALESSPQIKSPANG